MINEHDFAYMRVTGIEVFDKIEEAKEIMAKEGIFGIIGMIGCCITDTNLDRDQIIDFISYINFDYNHDFVAGIFDILTGSDPEKHFWDQDSDGRYQLTDKPSEDEDWFIKLHSAQLAVAG